MKLLSRNAVLVRLRRSLRASAQSLPLARPLFWRKWCTMFSGQQFRFVSSRFVCWNRRTRGGIRGESLLLLVARPLGCAELCCSLVLPLRRTLCLAPSAPTWPPPPRHGFARLRRRLRSPRRRQLITSELGRVSEPFHCFRCPLWFARPASNWTEAAREWPPLAARERERAHINYLRARRAAQRSRGSTSASLCAGCGERRLRAVSCAP